MRKFNNTLLIGLCLLAFTSCVKDENPTEKDENKISLNFAPVVVDPSTKATLTPNSDETVFDAEWETSDQIGICSLDNAGTPTEDNVLGTWNGTAFSTAFEGLEGESKSFIGIYPYNEEGVIEFGSARVQEGNDYNCAYDVMKSEKVTTTLTSDATIALPMHRETAIAYFHLTGTPAAGEKIQSATLTIDADEATPANIAGDIIYLDGEILAEGTSNSITITFADGTNPSADDFKLWFNVLPVSYTTLKLEVATEHYTMIINNTKGGSYEAGKLYKVSAAVPATKWVKKPDTYTLVTSALSDWRGDYLIAYSYDVFMDGSLAGGTAGVGKAQSHVNPDDALSGNNISVTWGDQHYVTIEAIDDNDLSQGYVIKSHSETTPYFYQSSNANGMTATNNKTTAAQYPITITFNSSSDVEIALGGKAQGAVLHYNNNTGTSGEMFRFYKNAGQKPIYLYKRTSSVPVATVAVTSVSLNKSSVETTVGSTIQLNATIEPTNASNKNVTWTSSDESIATVEDGLVTAIAAGPATITATTEDGNFTATCNVTVTAAPALSTMDAIFEAATTAGSTAANAKIQFNNWVVSGVKNSNAYVTDGTKGFIIYQSDHGFSVGDILSGTVSCKVQLFNGSAELTQINSATDGLTITTGGSLTPQSVSIGTLSGINTGAVITCSNLMYNGTDLSDGTNHLVPYNSLYSYSTLLQNRSYDITGVYLQYNDKKEILPRSANDIVLLAAQKYSVIISNSITNGTVSANCTEAAPGETVTLTATPLSGYALDTWTVKDADNTTITVSNGKFIMPGSAVTVSATFKVNGGGSDAKTETLTLSEITTHFTNDKMAYATGETYVDGDITWNVYGYADANNRPWMQLKKDKGVYVKISAPSAISEVRLTITSASNSSGGITDISKHTAFSGYARLKSADAAGDGATSDICSSNSVSNNTIVLTVPTPANNVVYVKVSTGARIWGIEVDY